MRIHDLAFAALVALSLTACTARNTSNDAPGATAAAPVASRADTAKQLGLVEPATAADPANPSRSCRTDSDCAVKNVGNCCGYFPMCVNKDARTDPAAVRAQCEKDGMSSICGFREVSGCQCVQGQCQSLSDGSVVM